MIKSELTTNRVTSLLSPETISSLVLKGDLSALTATQKVEYYNAMCERIGLDPATQPFKLLNLQGKQILYADKGATQQLCKIYNISTEVLKKEKIEDIYVVTVRASMPGERFTDDDGAVNVKGMTGDNLANALMKTVTKAKRRAVLALCGLGMLDETEIETIKGATTTEINAPTEVLQQPTATDKVLQDASNHVFPLISGDQVKAIKELAKTRFKSPLKFNCWLADKFAYSNAEEILADTYAKVVEELTALVAE